MILGEFFDWIYPAAAPAFFLLFASAATCHQCVISADIHLKFVHLCRITAVRSGRNSSLLVYIRFLDFCMSSVNQKFVKYSESLRFVIQTML